MSDKPVWLLDIDGVINAMTKKPNRAVWPTEEWHLTEARASGRNWPIFYASPVVDFITSVHVQGRAEIRWHTTWQEEAENLAKAVGLPAFPVAEAPEFKTEGLMLLRGIWWKRPAAERVICEERRPLVWTDDDAAWDLGRHGADEMRAMGQPVLIISPNQLTGLTPKQIGKIDIFLSDNA